MIRPIDNSPIRGRAPAGPRFKGSSKFPIERQIEPWTSVRFKSPQAASGEPRVSSHAPRGGRRLRGALAELTRDNYWLVCTSLFALLWAVELWVVQETTIESAQLDIWGGHYVYWVPKLRFVFDLCFAAGFSLCLRRRWLVVIALLTLLIDLALVAYSGSFHRTPSLLTIATEWNSSLQAGGLSLAAVPTWAALGLPAILLAKLSLLAMAARPTFSRRFTLGLAAACTLTYGGLMLGFNQLDPIKFSKLLNRRELAFFCVSRGYTLPWLMEWRYLGDKQILGTAMAQRTQTCDRLTPAESSLPVGNRLVIIQVESLGFDVMGARVNGREVAPFLNQLKDQAFYYRVTAPTYNGSADADFAMLTGSEPSRDAVNYHIPGYPFDDALPRFLERFDFRTTALMGGRGVIYNRRTAFGKMQFAQALFAEDIVERYSGRIESLGIRDSELLPLSSLLLRKSTGKVCHFVVTVASHAPFDSVRDDEKEIFPNSRDPNENYFNSIRYVDNTLRGYIMGLPTNTTVVIYGDHTAPGSYAGYDRDRSGSLHRVPCLIYNVGQDLGARQRTRGQSLATSGELTLADIANYLRAQVAGSQDATPAKHDVRLATSK